jgi:hypothetical protein
MTLQRKNVVVIGIVRRDRLIDNPINRSYSTRLESTFGIVEVTILHHYKVSAHDFFSSMRDQKYRKEKNVMMLYVLVVMVLTKHS